MRVQVYERRDHGFRWHFDGHPYVALVTLENTNQGQTQFISAGLSRWLRFLLYPLYAFPQIFSLFPRSTVETRPGDLLVMRGGRVLHRGVTLADEGERILLAYHLRRAGPQAEPLPGLHGPAAQLLGARAAEPAPLRRRCNKPPPGASRYRPAGRFNAELLHIGLWLLHIGLRRAVSRPGRRFFP